MKSPFIVGGALALLLAAADASAAKQGYSGELASDNEVAPPNTGDHGPFGYIEATFDSDTKRFCGRFYWEDLTGKPSGIHVHQSPTGMPDADGTSKFLIPIPTDANPESGEVKFNILLDTPFITSLVAGEVYGNIHTTINTTGEIRSTFFKDDGLEVQPCGAVTPQDAGVPVVDSGTTNPGATSSTSSSSSSGDDTPSGGDDTSDPKDETAAAKPAAKDGGCNTGGGVSDVFGITLAAVGLAFIATRRRRTRAKRED